jgi:hypothetical protein
MVPTLVVVHQGVQIRTVIIKLGLNGDGRVG